MEKENVLIFNGGGGCGYLLSRFINMSVKFHAISASSYPEISRFFYRDYKCDLPFISEENFVDELNKFIYEMKISFIIPMHDTIALALMMNQNKLHATIVCSPLETTRLCRYKSETYKALSKCEFVPRWWHNAEKTFENYDFPLFIKPDDGQGAKGTMLINNKEELLKALSSELNFVICEYLPGSEYTVDCFTDRKGNLLLTNPRSRDQVLIGQSILSSNVNPESFSEFEQIATQINSILTFRGYWFIQLKRDVNGALKLLEISTRFSGGVAHALAYGINIPVLALNDFSGTDVYITKNKYSVVTGKGMISFFEIHINYSTVYIDYDDTITCDNGRHVNSYVMSYLYQCRNNGKKIILLTKHTATRALGLLEDMHRLSICEHLFDSIIDMPVCASKASYIKKDSDSIFIDNSFSERKEVFEKCNIPVFDTPHVDCLFDHKL